jgi:hypothetical protein
VVHLGVRESMYAKRQVGLGTHDPMAGGVPFVDYAVPVWQLGFAGNHSVSGWHGGEEEAVLVRVAITDDDDSSNICTKNASTSSQDEQGGRALGLKQLRVSNVKAVAACSPCEPNDHFAASSTPQPYLRAITLQTSWLALPLASRQKRTTHTKSQGGRRGQARG